MGNFHGANSQGCCNLHVQRLFTKFSVNSKKQILTQVSQVFMISLPSKVLIRKSDTCLVYYQKCHQ